MIESSAAEFTTKVQGMIVALMEEVKQLDNATELANAALPLGRAKASMIQ